MLNLTPAEESALRAWLEDLASRMETSGVGVALLDAQITALEKTCADLRDSSQLRAQFRDKWTQAPDAEKTQYQTAGAVCDALNAAMEREKAIASLQGSEAVHGSSDLGARRRDFPTKGGVGTAMLADAELRSEACSPTEIDPLITDSSQPLPVSKH